MTDSKDISAVESRLNQLTRRRQRIMKMPAEKALDAIVSSPDALPLVHSFAEEDLYLLIHDIGPEDALPVLALASARQWEYILDLEMWAKDHVSLPATIKWMNLLMTADAPRLASWLLKEKPELLELTLFRNLTVMVREHDEDPSVFGTDAITFDDVYYFKFIPTAPQDPDAKAYDEKRKDLLGKILKRIAEEDYSNYNRLIAELMAIIPAETEEEMYRQRGIRLAEKGFLPFDEAVGIYQPLGRAEIDGLSRNIVTRGGEQLLPVSLASVGMVAPESLISRALEFLGESPAAAEIKIELAALCNRLIVADQRLVRDRDTLAEVVGKTCGYVSIGLHRMTDLETGLEPKQAAEMLQRHSLANLFRVGYDLAQKLKQKAETWKKGSWFVEIGLPISFWGETWVGVLGGLLVKQPRFFDNYKTGVLYREFQSAADVRETEKALNQLMAMDQFFELLAPDLPDTSQHTPTYENLMLTAWARFFLGMPPVAEPIPISAFIPFYEQLLPAPVSPPAPHSESDPPVHSVVPLPMKRSFLDWLVDRTGLDEGAILTQIGPVLEGLFDQIENEFGGVRSSDLDPRYIHLFMVSR